jgi:hypothetical protein
MRTMRRLRRLSRWSMHEYARGKAVKIAHTIMLLLSFALVSCDNEQIDCVSNSGPDTADPETSCVDFDPCTLDIYDPEHGCTHDPMPNGAQCVGDDDRTGQCGYGLCIVERDGLQDTVCAESSTGCYGYDPYVVKRFDGACIIEWCNYDKPGRSVQPKPAGSPCVRSIAKGSPEFRTGQCNACGECN